MVDGSGQAGRKGIFEPLQTSAMSDKSAQSTQLLDGGALVAVTYMAILSETRE